MNKRRELLAAGLVKDYRFRSHEELELTDNQNRGHNGQGDGQQSCQGGDHAGCCFSQTIGQSSGNGIDTNSCTFHTFLLSLRLHPAGHRSNNVLYQRSQASNKETQTKPCKPGGGSKCNQTKHLNPSKDEYRPKHPRSSTHHKDKHLQEHWWILQ